MSEYDIPMIRDGLCLKPYGNHAIEEFERVRQHKPVTVRIMEERNPDHLAKYWAVARAVANFCDDFDDAYDADFYARSHMRWMVKEIVLGDGRVAVRFKSIALGKMSQLDFDRFYDRALWLWAEKIGCDPETLLDQAAAA